MTLYEALKLANVDSRVIVLYEGREIVESVYRLLYYGYCGYTDLLNKIVTSVFIDDNHLGFCISKEER